jgi:hypothetical protein
MALADLVKALEEAADLQEYTLFLLEGDVAYCFIEVDEDVSLRYDICYRLGPMDDSKEGELPIVRMFVDFCDEVNMFVASIHIRHHFESRSFEALNREDIKSIINWIWRLLNRAYVSIVGGPYSIAEFMTTRIAIEYALEFGALVGGLDSVPNLSRDLFEVWNWEGDLEIEVCPDEGFSLVFKRFESYDKDTHAIEGRVTVEVIYDGEFVRSMEYRFEFKENDGNLLLNSGDLLNSARIQIAEEAKLFWDEWIAPHAICCVVGNLQDKLTFEPQVMKIISKMMLGYE